MVKYKTDPLSATFSALSDPTRRAILARLTRGDAPVGELAEPFDMSLPAVSKHLGVLEDARLIVRQRDGRIRRCRMNPEPLRAVWDWVERYREFWDERFDEFERYLRNEQMDGEKDKTDGETTKED